MLIYLNIQYMYACYIIYKKLTELAVILVLILVL